MHNALTVMGIIGDGKIDMVVTPWWSLWSKLIKVFYKLVLFISK